MRRLNPKDNFFCKRNTCGWGTPLTCTLINFSLGQFIFCDLQWRQVNARLFSNLPHADAHRRTIKATLSKQREELEINRLSTNRDVSSWRTRTPTNGRCEVSLRQPRSAGSGINEKYISPCYTLLRVLTERRRIPLLAAAASGRGVAWRRYGFSGTLTDNALDFHHWEIPPVIT